LYTFNVFKGRGIPNEAFYVVEGTQSQGISPGINNNNSNNNNNNNNNVECKNKVIPVTIGATGTISMPFRKYVYVSNIPGNHEVKELQKTAILGTTHILRKVLT
jgi:hypothetical protein